jgi:hypothetical protein
MDDIPVACMMCSRIFSMPASPSGISSPRRNPFNMSSSSLATGESLSAKNMEDRKIG